MFAWQLQVLPMVAVAGNPDGMVMPPGCPEAVDGGKPWQVRQAAAEMVAGRIVAPQTGIMLVPVVSPPGIFAPWQ